MSNLVYFAHHAGIRTILKMFREILKIGQDYDKVHPTRAIEETQFFQIWEVMEKIGVPCNIGNHTIIKAKSTMILTMGNQMDLH